MSENQEENLQCQEGNTEINIFNIPTFLSLMKKYPEAREDILLLRKTKNSGYYVSLILSSILAFIIGFIVRGFL